MMPCCLQAAKVLLDLQQEHEGLRRKHTMQVPPTTGLQSESCLAAEVFPGRSY